MPSSVIVNGKQVSVPGVYGHLDTSALGGKNVLTGRVGVVGEFPSFEPGKPYVFTNPQALRSWDPSDIVLQRLAQLLFSPALDDRVTGVSDVTLVNVIPKLVNVAPNCSQAGVTLVDGNPSDLNVDVNSLVLKAKKWGVKGNQVYYKLAPNAGSNKLLDISLVGAYGVQETYAAVGSGDIAAFLLNSAVCTELVSAAPTNDIDAITFNTTSLTWTWKKTVYFNGTPLADNAVYTFAGNKLPVTGTLSASFDQAIPNPGTVTATAAGLTAAGAPVTATAVFVDPLAANAPVVFQFDGQPVQWGRLDTVKWHIAGGVFNPAPPKFSLWGTAFNLTLSQFNTVADIVSYINNYASKGWVATAVSPLAAAVPGSQLDKVASSNTHDTSVYGRADLWAIVKALGSSGLVVAARDPLAVLPPWPWGTNNTYEGNLAGGADGSISVATDYENAFKIMLNEDVQIVVPFSTDFLAAQKAVDHCKDAPVYGAGERNAYWGCAAATSLANIKALYTNLLNSRHISVCAQNLLRPHPVNGQQESLDPRYMAIQAAAIQAGSGIAVPGTNKRPNLLGTEQSWTLRTDDEQVIRAGIYAFTKDNLSYKVLRSLTTWLSDDNPCLTETSANESGNTSIRRVRAQLAGKVGDPALNVSANQFLGVVTSELAKQVNDGVIAAYKNVVLTQVADKFRVDYDYKPVLPVNFFDVWAHAYV